VVRFHGKTAAAHGDDLLHVHSLSLASVRQNCAGPPRADDAIGNHCTHGVSAGHRRSAGSPSNSVVGVVVCWPGIDRFGEETVTLTRIRLSLGLIILVLAPSSLAPGALALTNSTDAILLVWNDALFAQQIADSRLIAAARPYTGP